MKKLLFFIPIFLLIFSIFFFGCCSNNESTAIVILAGKHGNSIKHNIPLEEELKRTYSNGGNTCIISIDGKPEIVYDNDSLIGCLEMDECESIRQAYCDNDVYCMDNIITPFVEQICRFLDEKVLANDAEVDTLKAFQQAKSAFYALGDQEHKKIIVFDSGLCTQGKLNFNQTNFLDITDTEITDIIEELYEKKEIPELDNVVVDWYGIGQVYKPQEELSQLQISKLKFLWSSIIEKAGGTVNFFDVISYEGYSNVPEVATIKLSKEKIEYIDIFFEGGEDIYINENETDLKIKELSDLIKNDPEATWAIIGCTASSTEKYAEDLKNDHLSLDRTKKVYEHLLKYDTPKRQLRLYAAGPYDPWHVPDSTNGEIDDDLARPNRKVRVINTSSSQFLKHKDKLNQYEVEISN